MKFKDLEVDDQFTIASEVCLPPGTVFQKQDNEAVLTQEIIFDPNEEVEKID